MPKLKKEVIMDTRMNFTLPAKMKVEVEDQAYDSRISISQFIRDALEHYMKKDK